MSTSKPETPSDRYHHGDLRRALVDEALVLLAESGDGGFSLRELARRVGVTANASYRHFASKDALMLAVAAEGFRRLRVAQQAAEAAAEGAERRLVAGGLSYLRFAHANPRPAPPCAPGLWCTASVICCWTVSSMFSTTTRWRWRRPR